MPGRRRFRRKIVGAMDTPASDIAVDGHYDLIIIGTGSGNSIPGPEFEDKSIAIIEKGSFGGTCLNVGCIPTKMYVYAADAALETAQSGRLGVECPGQLRGLVWHGHPHLRKPHRPDRRRG